MVSKEIQEETLHDEEIQRRLDAALKKSVTMPPKPRKKGEPNNKRKGSKSNKRGA